MTFFCSQKEKIINLSVLGWGTLAYQYYAPSWLQEAGVTIYPFGDCGELDDTGTEPLLSHIIIGRP